jgi:hypothetical protein
MWDAHRIDPLQDFWQLVSTRTLGRNLFIRYCRSKVQGLDLRHTTAIVVLMRAVHHRHHHNCPEPVLCVYQQPTHTPGPHTCLQEPELLETIFATTGQATDLAELQVTSREGAQRERSGHFTAADAPSRQQAGRKTDVSSMFLHCHH